MGHDRDVEKAEMISEHEQQLSDYRERVQILIAHGKDLTKVAKLSQSQCQTLLARTAEANDLESEAQERLSQEYEVVEVLKQELNACQELDYDLY